MVPVREAAGLEKENGGQPDVSNEASSGGNGDCRGGQSDSSLRGIAAPTAEGEGGGYTMLTKSQLHIFFLVLAIAGLLAAPAARLSAQGRSPSYFQAKNLFVFGNPAMMAPGAAALTRTQQGISFRVHTSGLMAGVYTIWVVIFNRPENCAAGPGACMAADLNNPAVAGSMLPGAGAIAGMDGVANFTGGVNEGDPPSGLEVNFPNGTAKGLKDSFRAEIHLVVRTHGAVIPGHAATQLTTFEACGACGNVQAAIFEAVQ
jgi:hypothetical protein